MSDLTEAIERKKELEADMYEMLRFYCEHYDIKYPSFFIEYDEDGNIIDLELELGE